MNGKILILDYAWPDLSIETDIFGEAGYAVVSVQDDPKGRPATELVADCDAVMTNWARLGDDVFQAGPDLRAVARFGVGTDNIDLVAARSRGLQVTYVPDYCVEDVSDHVLALTLAWYRGVVRLASEARDGKWTSDTTGLRRLRALTVGIWGYGRIGRRTAEKFHALGCRVLVHNRSALNAEPAQLVTLEEMLAASDIVSLHMPAPPSGDPVVSAEILALMKPGSLLVNTARGTLVDTEALLKRLDTGSPGAAALDVVAGEPALSPELSAHERVIITPHVAFASAESLPELRRRACEDVVRVLQGRPPFNPVVPKPTARPAEAASNPSSKQEGEL